MSKDLVAIITRTKNRNLLLERAVQSVVSQTSKSYIHVILNDGGDKAGVEEVLAKYPDKDRKVIHNKDSVGLTAALNQAIRSVDTEYIAILDDDDSWDEQYLELMVGHLESTGAKGVVGVIDRVIEEISDQTVKRISIDRWRPDIDAVTLYGQCIDNYAPTVAFVYRRDVYDELNGYDESLGVSEDWEFTIRFLLKYDIDFLKTNKALAFYHHRPEARGAAGNSVFAGVDQHKYHMNMLANHFLRKDINDGKFGVGYIINSLRYNRDFLIPAENERMLEQTVRLEGHVNYSEDLLEKHVTNSISDLASSIKDLKRHSFGYRVGRKLKRILKF